MEDIRDLPPPEPLIELTLASGIEQRREAGVGLARGDQFQNAAVQSRYIPMTNDGRFR